MALTVFRRADEPQHVKRGRQRIEVGVVGEHEPGIHSAPGDGLGRLRRVARPLQVATRVVIALMRSVHELLWAILFLAAFGLNTASAVIALAIPFAGTLAKVFSEMLDEAPDNAARALHAAGAGPLSVLVFGRVPRALADMAAYTFYRFECAVRSSAVLGFFGYPTLGFHLSLAFEDLRFREVWSYIYAIVALVEKDLDA